MQEYSALTPELVAESDVIYMTRVQKERFASAEEYERCVAVHCTPGADGYAAGSRAATSSIAS